MKTIKEELSEAKATYGRVKAGGYYWFVNNLGDIRYSIEQYTTKDDFSYSQGNYFCSVEQAKQYQRYITIRGKVREIANRFEKCDWSTTKQEKRHLFYNIISNRIETNMHYTIKVAGAIYCSSPNLLTICLKEIGEDDLKFYCKYEV